VDRLPVGLDEGPGLVASVWRYRWLVAVVVLLGAAAGVGVSTRQAVMYEATAQVLLTGPSEGRVLDPTAGQSVEPDRYVRNQAAFMASPLVLERAVQLTNGRVPVKLLRKRLTAEPSQQLDLVTVRVLDPSARGAAELADAVGRAYELTAVGQARAAARRTVGRLRATEATLRGQLDELERRVQAAPDDRSLRVERDAAADQLAQVGNRAREFELEGSVSNPVALREPAEVPEEPVQPRPKLLAVAGGLLGFALAAGLAWWLSWRRQPVVAASGLPRPEPAWAAPRGFSPASAPVRLAEVFRSRLRGGGQDGASTSPVALTSPGVRPARARTRLIRMLRSQPENGAVALAEWPLPDNGHQTAVNGSDQFAHGDGLLPDALGLNGSSTTIMPTPEESDGDSTPP